MKLIKKIEKKYCKINIYVVKYKMVDNVLLSF